MFKSKLKHFLLSIIIIMMSFYASCLYAVGTVWEDWHIVAKNHCPDFADTMTIEDFDEFASLIYDGDPNTPPQPSKEIKNWLCAIKRFQSEQNYVSIVSAQFMGRQLTSLPLLLLNKSILSAARCASLPRDKRKSLNGCDIPLQLKMNSQVIAIPLTIREKLQEQKTLEVARVLVPFSEVKHSIETVAILLLKEAELRQMNGSKKEIANVIQQQSKLLNKIRALQNKIDDGLDKFKHKIDIVRLRNSKN